MRPRERPGRVRVFQNGQVLAAPALVLTDVAAVGEGGLLGIAVHPDFASNHFVYLAYTARLAGGSRETRVVRYREVGNTLGEPAVILDRVPAADIHDGARVRFGPDRKLYVTMGDTAAPPTAQDLGTLTGKILRLNDDGSDTMSSIERPSVTECAIVKSVTCSSSGRQRVPSRNRPTTNRM